MKRDGEFCQVMWNKNFLVVQETLYLSLSRKVDQVNHFFGQYVV